jgi:amino acid transporter
MSGGRYLFAMAREGQAPAALSRLSRFDTPHVALLAQVAHPLPGWQPLYATRPERPLHNTEAGGALLVQAAAAIGLLLLPGAGLSGLVSFREV